MNHMHEKDKELSECKMWMEAYERGHGLVEAVRYQKKLKVMN